MAHCISFIERRLWSLACFVFSCAYSCNLHKCKGEKYVESFVTARCFQLLKIKTGLFRREALCICEILWRLLMNLFFLAKQHQSSNFIHKTFIVKDAICLICMWCGHTSKINSNAVCDQFFSSSLDCLTKYSMVTSIIRKFCCEQLMLNFFKVHKQAWRVRF